MNEFTGQSSNKDDKLVRNLKMVCIKRKIACALDTEKKQVLDPKT